MTSKGQGQLSASTISSGVPPGQGFTAHINNLAFGSVLRLGYNQYSRSVQQISPQQSVNAAIIHVLIESVSTTELPGPPTNLAISNIGPRSVTLQFKPGYDGKTSISRWQVEAQVGFACVLKC